MKKIIVIGNSQATAPILEKFAGREDFEITMFALDGHLPYDRSLFPELISKEIKENKLTCVSSDCLESKNIHVLKERKVSRINFKKKQITTEEKDKLDYDVLILSDTFESKMPEIKGTNKTGVFIFRRLDEVKKAAQTLFWADTIIIEGNSLNDVRLAQTLIKQKKEVVVVFASSHLEPNHFDKKSSDYLCELLENEGLRIIFNNSIAEVLGDSDVKAVRLKNGKVFAAQAVIFTSPKPDLKMFNDPDLILSGQGIKVDSQFRTTIEDVFAVDRLAVKENEETAAFNRSELKKQGESVACAILQENSAPNLAEFAEIVFGDFLVHYFGNITSDQTAYVQKDSNGHSTRIFIENGLLAAAVIINCPQDKEFLTKYIGANVLSQDFLSQYEAESVSSIQSEEQKIESVNTEISAGP